MSRTRPNEKPAAYTKSGQSGETRAPAKVVRRQTYSPSADSITVRRPAKARGPVARERLSGDRRGAEGEAVGRIEQRDRLFESYLRGLTDHRNNLDEYLGELERERDELERERRDLDLKIEANEEKRERVSSYIEEMPQLRDMALRFLVRGMEESEDG